MPISDPWYFVSSRWTLVIWCWDQNHRMLGRRHGSWCHGSCCRLVIRRIIVFHKDTFSCSTKRFIASVVKYKCLYSVPKLYECIWYISTGDDEVLVYGLTTQSWEESQGIHVEVKAVPVIERYRSGKMAPQLHRNQWVSTLCSFPNKACLMTVMRYICVLRNMVHVTL